MRDSGAGISHELPLILGVDGAGEIVDAPVGSHLKLGDPVVLYPMANCSRCRACQAGDQASCSTFSISGETRHGSFAELIAMPEHCFVSKPDNLSWEAAATLPVAYLTAWRMLFSRDPLQSAETVLIVGIGGGVAAACLQMAKMVGAQTIVTSSSDKKLEWASGLGADFGINYNTDRVAKQVIALTGGEGVDMVVDTVGEASWGDSLRSLRRGGRLVTCGATTGGHPSADIQRLFSKQLAIYGSTTGSLEEFRQLIEATRRGLIQPLIDRQYPLAELAEGLERMERGEQRGKLVVNVSS
jgi:NADPH:quinone reductase-like Zn-dependent oxidoreductase